MDTTEVYFHVEVDEGVDRHAVAAELQRRVAALENVAESEATPDETQLTGAEIVAGIALGVAVIKGGKQLTVELKSLIDAVAEAVRSIHGLKKAVVELSDRTVPLEEVGEGEVAALAADG